MYSDRTNKLSYAQYYVSIGFSVFPCHTIYDGLCTCENTSCTNVAKHPCTLNGVYDATKDDVQLDVYFTGNFDLANVAVACGKTSNVLVLDVDSIGSLTTLESEHGTLPKTWTVETGGGGRHYYFKHVDGVKNSVKFCGSLDVRTNGGYVLLPPSLHKSGKQYRWLVSPDECELADIPAWLLALMPKHETLPETKSDSLPRCGSESGNETVVASEPGNETEGLRIERAKTEAERLALYLERTPPAVSGGGGHKHTFAVVCRCVELFGGLSDAEILSALQAWNDRCVPPWKEHELRHKLTDARAKVPQTTNDENTKEPEAENVNIDVWPILNPDALYGIVGEIVAAIEPETEADTVGVVLTLLTMFGIEIGKNAFVYVGADTHHANLFTCIVGDTASGKGMALSIGKQLIPPTETAHGLSSGEGLIERVADKLDDDGSVFHIQDAKRLLCIETEFARPITAMRREGNTLSPLLRSAWDCSPLECLTRGKTKLQASNAYVSILAHITPDEINKLLRGSVEIGNGFSNRFLWTLVRSTKSLPHGGNASVLNPYRERLKIVVQHAKQIGEVKRSPGADILWESVYADLKQAKPGAFGKAVERGRAYVVRLSLIYALLDCSPIIQTHHLKAALAVWRYCEDSANMIFSDDRLTVTLRSLVNRKPGIKRSELRHAPGIKNVANTEQFDAALAWLIGRGDIVHVPVYENRQADCYYPGIRGHRDVGVSMPEHGNGEPYVPTSPVSAKADSLPRSESGNEPVSAYVPTSPVSVFTSIASFLDASDKASVPTSPDLETATLVSLIEWRNAKGVQFYKRHDGSIWVTTEYDHVLTPAMENAIRANQATLTAFVHDTPTVQLNRSALENDPIWNDPLFQELRNL